MASQSPTTVRQEWIDMKKAAIHPAFFESRFKMELADIERALETVQFQFGHDMAHPVSPSRHNCYRIFARMLQCHDRIPAGVAECVRLLHPGGEFAWRLKQSLREAGWDPEKVTDPRLSTAERRLEGQELGLVLRDYDNREADMGLGGERDSPGSDRGASGSPPGQREAKPELPQISFLAGCVEQASVPSANLGEQMVTVESESRRRSRSSSRRLRPDGNANRSARKKREARRERRIMAMFEARIRQLLPPTPVGRLPSVPEVADPQPSSSNATAEVEVKLQGDLKTQGDIKTQGEIKTPRPFSSSIADIPRLPAQRPTPTSPGARPWCGFAAELARTPSPEPDYDLTAELSPEQRIPDRTQRRKDAMEQLSRQTVFRKHGKDTNDPVDLTVNPLRKTYTWTARIQKPSSSQARTSTQRRETTQRRESTATLSSGGSGGSRGTQSQVQKWPVVQTGVVQGNPAASGGLAGKPKGPGETCNLCGTSGCGGQGIPACRYKYRHDMPDKAREAEE